MGVCRQLVGIIGILVAITSAPVALHAAQSDATASESIGIHTPDNAKNVADVWLKLSRFQGVKIGQVHDVGLIYVVDIVQTDGEERVVNQLIIRSKDGFTQTVY